MIDRRRFALAVTAAAAWSGASAQSFATRPIRLEAFAHRTVEAERATLGRAGLLRKD